VAVSRCSAVIGKFTADPLPQIDKSAAPTIRGIVLRDRPWQRSVRFMNAVSA
jgi:hypothetical protein